jgi:SAM-dependent methyltransferase
VKIIEVFLSTLGHLLSWIAKESKFSPKNMLQNKGDYALDFGCGERGYLPELAERYSYVIGMDMCHDYPEAYSLKRAKALVRKGSLNNVDLVLADCHNPPFRDGIFDFIVCTHVLEHLMRPEEALREVNRILRLGGRIFIAVPSLSEIFSSSFSSNPVIQWGKILLTRALDDILYKRCKPLLPRIFFKEIHPKIRLRTFIPRQYYAKLWYKKYINIEEYAVKFLRKELVDPHHKHWFLPKEWINIVETSGLKIMESRGICNVYMIAMKTDNETHNRDGRYAKS